jgi:hypothetical protein
LFSFLFPFLFVYQMCVLSMHSSSGTLRTMCGSRTGGWSLPCVISDWQHCVELFLAKYCRCRLRLDSCWCRWRTSAKGRCRWGLQVWRRQVGFVRGTRWPAGSSAGRMVARTARWSQWAVSWLSHKTKVWAGTSWEPSHEWWLAVATSSSRGLRWFTRKPPGYSAEPQNQGRRPGVDVWPKPAWPVLRTGLTGLGSQGAGSFEAEDTRRDRKACVEATRSAVAGHPSDGAMKTNSQSALERMAAISWNPSSFAFLLLT